MAPLKIIGGGFGRTGTDSLRTALDKLGYTTHHMKNFNQEDGRVEMFIDAYDHPEKEMDWDFMYEGYDAAVDWPTCTFLERLMKKYPHAKVILTVRDPDSWYRSVKNSIYIRHNANRRDPRIKGNPRVHMAGKIILDGAFDHADRFADEEAMKNKFVQNNERVRAIVPQENLLVLELGGGWEPLCKFLDKPIPDEPYPHVNSTVEMSKRFPELAPPASNSTT